MYRVREITTPEQAKEIAQETVALWKKVTTCPYCKGQRTSYHEADQNPFGPDRPEYYINKPIKCYTCGGTWEVVKDNGSSNHNNNVSN